MTSGQGLRTIWRRSEERFSPEGQERRKRVSGNSRKETVVKQGQELGKIETIKANWDLAPVSGRVVDVNQELESSPYLINEDPYGAGWIYKIRLDDFGTAGEDLLRAEDYLELMKEKIAEEMKKNDRKTKKVVVLPRSGIGKVYGALARETTYELVDRVRPGLVGAVDSVCSRLFNLSNT
ncbi:MAG: hypothetical protein MZW92_25775 [Comamonadaceae bacterium]|nr:hypothetical protein [Comamonadaceae bacterium]